jgi:IS30 family transposase
MRSIAKDLNRAASSISREIARNGGINRYRAALAEKAFLKRAKRPKALLLAENTMLRDTVCRLLREDWSPEQISGRLRESQLVGEPKMYVSYETPSMLPVISNTENSHTPISLKFCIYNALSDYPDMGLDR